MATSFIMASPGQSAGVSFTSNLTGNTYTAGANGTVSVLASDVNSAELAGWSPVTQNPSVALTLSTAAGVYVIPGLVNTIPVSTIAAVALLPAPSAAQIGTTTTLVAASTGNFVITSSGCTILSDKAVACTTLTCNTGVANIVALGSTLYQILNRSIVSNTSAAITYGIASS